MKSNIKLTKPGNSTSLERPISKQLHILVPSGKIRCRHSDGQITRRMIIIN